MDRVATAVIALDGSGGIERFADYGQWAENARRRPASKKEKPAQQGAKAQASKGKRLSYADQREWEGMEAAVLAAEERLATARRRAEDPSIATDAAALQARLDELETAGGEVDRLYARWAELEAKRG